MKLLLLTFLLFCCIESLIGQQFALNDTIYLDKDWKECDEGEHKFYRVLTLSKIEYEGRKLYRLCDYRKSGTKQMTAFLLENDITTPFGPTTYFRKNGRGKRLYVYDYKNAILVFPEYKNPVPHISLEAVPNAKLQVDYNRKGKVKLGGLLIDDCTQIGEWYFANFFGNYIVTNFDANNDCYVEKFINKYDELIAEGGHCMGVKTGVWRRYDTEPYQLKSEIVYKNGKITERAQYHNNGTLSYYKKYDIKGNIKIRMHFYENGQLRYQGIYEAGKLITESKFDDEGRQLFFE